jgi:hypothetical protein
MLQNDVCAIKISICKDTSTQTQQGKEINKATVFSHKSSSFESVNPGTLYTGGILRRASTIGNGNI